MNLTEDPVGEFKMESIGNDPYIFTSAIGSPLNALGSVIVRMDYKASVTITDGEFYFGRPGATGGISTGQNIVFNKTDEWTPFELDITNMCKEFAWGVAANHRLRFDFTQIIGPVLYVRNMEILITSGVSVATFVGGVDGIGTVDRRVTHTGYYLRKYNNWKSDRDNPADGSMRLFRLAEIYLNFAESAYQSNGPDTQIDLGGGMSMSARDAVNAIRQRAGMPDFPTDLSATDFEKKYRNERRIEFAYEDHRYFDVRRWKILPETERYVTGMRIVDEGNDNFTYTRISFERLSYLDKYYLYPIEQTEVNKMQDHTGVNWQNPGW
jgi:hypothetical protein